MKILEQILVRGIKCVRSMDCRFYVAQWIRRFARFLDKTEPGPLFIVCFSCVIGFAVGFMDSGIEYSKVVIPLHKYVWISVQVLFKFGLTGLITLYGIWEFVQGFKWLNKWAEKYQYGKKY